MAGKSTYADLVKKNVADSSPEPEEQPVLTSEVNSKTSQASKPTKSEEITNGHASKSVSPVPMKEVVEVKTEKPVEIPQIEAEPEDNTGFILIKGRERKFSTASRQSNYRGSRQNSTMRSNYKKNDSEGGKKMSFDQKRDEEKMKYLNRFAKKSGLCFQQKNGDLFSAEPHVSLAHCVSEDLEAKDGITKQFKERFGRVDELKAQNVKTGGCAQIESNDRFLFYMVTRNFSYHRPYYSSLEKSLKELRKQCNLLNVTDLAMPLIGNRQDQLDWDLVAKIIDHVFSGTDVNLTVFKYKSERRPPPHSSRQRKRVDRSEE